MNVGLSLSFSANPTGHQYRRRKSPIGVPARTPFRIWLSAGVVRYIWNPVIAQRREIGREATDSETLRPINALDNQDTEQPSPIRAADLVRRHVAVIAAF